MKNYLIENLIKRIKNNILNESVFDKYASTITKIIVKGFKNKKNVSEIFVLERGGEEAEFEVNVKFVENKNMGDPYDISGSAGDEDIDIKIKYNPNHFPKAMNDFVSEIKETIVHELEHIGQHNFEDMYIQSKKFKNNLEYLTSDKEVPAYVKGFIARANRGKKSLSSVMDEWFKENKKKFDNPEKDWEIVKDVWMSWAKEKRNQFKVKKFN
jgi:hypothetical protein